MTGKLDQFGYETYFGVNETNASVGRVITAHLNRARVIAADGEADCLYAPNLEEPGRYGGACAGDWVRLSDIPGGKRISEILPRKTCVARRAAGPVSREQVMAANVELALIITSMNADFNPSRIERYIACVSPGGATPVVVLSKADLCADRASVIAAAQNASSGAKVLAVSAVTGENMEALAARMRGRSSALIGMSGVGKSSVVNRLAGETLMKVNAIREDDARGRHTTTHREMIALPGGIVAIDTPGMREMGLWESGGVNAAYADIASLAKNCRFRDCRHESEPGCAVQSAVSRGELDARRLRSYRILLQEDARARRRERIRARPQPRGGRPEYQPDGSAQ